jgi:hypothetical protein
VTRLHSALWLPLFDDLADPRVVAGLAAEAEQAGQGCSIRARDEPDLLF